MSGDDVCDDDVRDDDGRDDDVREETPMMLRARSTLEESLRSPSAIERLLGIMQQLRDPELGCPWDRQQDFSSITPHTLEEAYEVADAVSRAEPDAIRDELGDLLFQVVFLSELGRERGWFDFDAVADTMARKLIRRHPHVFGASESPDSPDATRIDAAAPAASWESIKAAERAGAGELGTLSGVALALPALVRATKLGKRAGRVGFDWPAAEAVRAKVIEELGELDETLVRGESHDRQQEELGDLLFALANWARRLGLDPEAALRGSNQKFEQRFAWMERRAMLEGRALEGLSLAEWEALWVDAKRALAAKVP